MNKTIVLIPHYNNFLGLKKSVESIKETENVDILIVDDGSQKNRINESIINSSFNANGIIYYIYLKKNEGIEHALNKGLDFILKKGHRYIARLDCGDLCLNDRFKIQEKYLEENPKIKLLGSNVICIDEQGHFLYNLRMPIKYKEIKKYIYLNNILIHPSVIFQSDALKEIGLYPVKYRYAEDYAFFFNFIKKYNVENIDDFLVKIEINNSGISIQKRKKQIKSRIKIIKNNFYFGFYPIWGLVRSYILLFIPYKLILYLKMVIKNK